VDVEVVGVAGAVGELPDLSGADGDDGVDSGGVHAFAVDAAGPVELELAGGDGVVGVGQLVVGDPVRWRLRWGEVVRGAHLEDVERVVAAGEAVLDEVEAQVGRLAAEHGTSARAESGEDLNTLSR
jgi:hypothetical protein